VQLKESLLYNTYRSFAYLIRISPKSLAYKGAFLGGDLMRHIMQNRREIFRRNLKRVVPNATEKELDQLVTKGFHSYAQYWVDAARVVKFTRRQLMQSFTAIGYEPAFKAMRAGQGVLMGLAHLGSWEAGGAWLAAKGFEMYTVAEELKPPELFQWFVKEREEIGIHVMPASLKAVTNLSKVLKQGGLVGLICDRDLTGNGIDVEFFGETTKLPAGPATLAIRTNSLVVTAAVYTVGPGEFYGVVSEPINYSKTKDLKAEVRNLTQAIAKNLEDHIRYKPEQWHMLQPNWPSDKV
jgi:lauroyl/myristoyl acyltransferase